MPIVNVAYALQRAAQVHREKCDAAVLAHRAAGGKTVPIDMEIPRPPITYTPEASFDDSMDVVTLVLRALRANGESLESLLAELDRTN